MDKIHFHETKTAKKKTIPLVVHTYIAYKGYHPRVSKTLVKAAKSQHTREGPPDL